MAFNFTDLSGQRFQQDLQTASGYKPLIKKDLEAAYGRYKDVGVKMGRVKGKSDAELYKQATTDVLNWWKYNKNKAAQAAAARAAAERAAQAQAAPASQAPAAQAPAYSAAGFSGIQGTQGAVAPASTASTTRNVSKATIAKRKPDPSYVRAELMRAGLGNVLPPAYALASNEAFNAWLQSITSQRATREKRGVRTVTAPRNPAPKYGTFRPAARPTRRTPTTQGRTIGSSGARAI